MEAVISDGHGLPVAQLHERFHVEAIIGLRVVAFGSRDVGAVREGLACEQADASVVPALRKVVADLEAVLSPAKLARGTRREVIGKREKYLGPKSLQKRSPSLAWQGGLERADALCRDNRNAFGLTRQAKELFISGRFALPDRGKVLVLIA